MNYFKTVLNVSRTCSSKNFIPLKVNKSPICLSAVNRFEDKLSKAMKSYMKKVQDHDNFIKEQFQQFEMGKLYLANMMGKNPRAMTEEEIDKAIEYLLPSGLFVPGARPKMKSPKELFKKKKVAVEFDITGRPFVSLFYTTNPNFCQSLHDAAAHLERLNQHEAKLAKQHPNNPLPKPLNLIGSDWLSKEELESMFSERLFTVEYEKFLEVFNCLAKHPYSLMVEDFVKTYRKELGSHKITEAPTPTVLDDGSLEIVIEKCKRDTSFANVKMKYPGTGILKINGLGIDYFNNIQSREQASLQKNCHTSLNIVIK